MFPVFFFHSVLKSSSCPDGTICLPSREGRVSVHQLRLWEGWTHVYNIIMAAGDRSPSRKATHVLIQTRWTQAKPLDSFQADLLLVTADGDGGRAAAT